MTNHKCAFCGAVGEWTHIGRLTGKALYFCSDAHLHYFNRREERHRRKEEHRCIDCGKELRPIIVWQTRCPKHIRRNRHWQNMHKDKEKQNG